MTTHQWRRQSPSMCRSRHQPSLLSRPESTASRPHRVTVSCNSSTSMRRCITRKRRHSGACKRRFWLLDPKDIVTAIVIVIFKTNLSKRCDYVIGKTRTLIMIHEVWIYQIQAGVVRGNLDSFIQVCCDVITRYGCCRCRWNSLMLSLAQWWTGKSLQ